MTSIINQTRDTENFIEKIDVAVYDYFHGQTEDVQPYSEPPTEGNVTHTQITSKITFKKDGETFDDFIWEIEIEFNIELVVAYINLEGCSLSVTIPGFCKADARVNFPSNTFAIDDIQEIISNIEVEITDCYFERDKTKEEEELENEHLAYSEWQFKITSMSEDEVIGMFIEMEKEIARLKLVVEAGEAQKRL
jgi:hypothetical protein